MHHVNIQGLWCEALVRLGVVALTPEPPVIETSFARTKLRTPLASRLSPVSWRSFDLLRWLELPTASASFIVVCNLNSTAVGAAAKLICHPIVPVFGRSLSNPRKANRWLAGPGSRSSSRRLFVVDEQRRRDKF